MSGKKQSIEEFTTGGNLTELKNNKAKNADI